MKVLPHLAFVAAISFLLFSCKKDEANYALEGVVTHARTGEPLPVTYVSVQKQSVSNGTFGASYSTAATDVTNGSGHYQMSWSRENFASLKFTADRENYIRREIDLNIDNFTDGRTVTLNASLYPEAFVSVHIQNTGPASTSDILNFTFTNAQFDCACCNNGWKVFEGATVDTTFQCRLYGDMWLKYQKVIITQSGDTLVSDSVYCPAFETTPIGITY
jgi:hypothetical protein